MKKRAAAVLLALLFLLCSPLGSYSFARDGPESSFVFPASLQLIEEEAFVGVAARSLILRDGFQVLGARAFADAKNLTDVYLPASLTAIGEGALPNRADLTIHGEAGSYAEEWAAAQQLSFAADYGAYALSSGSRFARVCLETLLQIPMLTQMSLLWLVKRARERIRSMRPQDRPELNPIDYRFP